MNQLARLTINAKLFGGFAVIILLIITILVTAYVALNEAQTADRKIIEENLGNLYDLPTLRSNINAQRLAFAMMLETDRSKWGPWLDELQQRRKAADDIVNNLILRFRETAVESDVLGTFIAIRDSYQGIQEAQTHFLVEEGKRAKALSMFLGIQMQNHSRMRALIADLERRELSEARMILARTDEVAGQRSRAFLLMGLASVLLAGALAVYTSRTVSSYVRELRAGGAALAYANRSLMVLNECNSIAIHATDETRLLEDICRSIVKVGGYKLAWVGYADDDKDRSVRPMAFAGDDGDYIEHANISWGDNERGKGPTGVVIRTGEVVVVQDTSTEPGYDPWRYRASEKGYRSSAAFPLRDAGKVYGALMVYSGRRQAFNEGEITLLSELADNVAYATTAIREQCAHAQAERKAAEAAAYNRSLLEASLDPLIAISASGRIIDVNKAMEEMTGRCRTELIGKDFADCFTDAEKAHNVYREVLSRGELRDYHLTIRHASGWGTDVLFNASVVRNEAGELRGVFAAARESRAGKPGGGN